MTTIAVYSIKGGVGKTAASVNLAYLAAREGAQTLLCDLDPQGSSSFYFRIRPAKRFGKKQFLKGGREIRKNIRGTDYENLDLLPSTLSFRNLDLSLNRVRRSKKRLGIILRPLQREYDFLFLDCSPGIGLVAENVFQAADYLLLPCIPTTLSMLTYEKLVSFFESKNLDASKILPIFSMVEKRKKMHRETLEREIAPNGAFLKAHIPYLSDIEQMGLRREPILCYRPRSRAAQSYEHLWQDIKKAMAIDAI